MNILRTIPLVAALAWSTSACTVTTTGPSPAAGGVVEAEMDYEPTYYGEYVVYYDDGGLPYYYSSGTVQYIPRTDVHFNVYVSHYRQHRVNYRRWHERARSGRIERRQQWEQARKKHPTKRKDTRPDRRKNTRQRHR